MRFKYDRRKSDALRQNPARKVDFVEIQAVWHSAYYLDRRSDDPFQFRAIGWVKGRLFTVIFEERSDSKGDYIHLVTLWRSTKEERNLYEEHA